LKIIPIRKKKSYSSQPRHTSLEGDFYSPKSEIFLSALVPGDCPQL